MDQVEKISFSRHAKRRMKLYGITERDVMRVIDEGESETDHHTHKTNFVLDALKGFKYPLKVVIVETSESRLVITAYPVKKARKGI